MPVYKINKEQMALGLSWLPPGAIASGISENRKSQELSALKPRPCGYTEIETTSGLQVGTVTEIQDLGHVSAAAWLAITKQSAVLVERLNENEYWLCAVEDGAVFPAGDIVGDRDYITVRIEEIVSDTAGTSIGCYDNSNSCLLPNAEPLGFSDLIPNGEPPEILACRPLQIRKLKKPYIAVFAIVLLAAGGIFGWQFYLKSVSKNATRLNIERNAQIAKVYEKERSQIEAALQQNFPALLVSLTDLIYERPLYTAGWSNIAYEWRDDTLTSNWERSYGLITDIATHLEDHVFKLNEKTGKILETIPHPAPKTPFETKPNLRLTATNARLQLLDRLATLPGRWSLEAANQQGIHYKTKKSQISGSVQGLNSAAIVASQLRDQPIHVQVINFSLKYPFQWSMKGEFYEQSKTK